MHRHRIPSPAPAARAGSVRPRPPFLAVAAVLIVSAMLVAACGTGGRSGDTAPAQKQSATRPSSTTSTTEASTGSSSSGIASGILSTTDGAQVDGTAVGTAEQQCLGAAVIGAVGEDEATRMSAADLSEYTPAQLEVLRRAFNKCVTGRTLAPGVVTNFYQGAGVTTPPANSVSDCVAAAIDGRTGDIVAESAAAEASTALPKVTLEALDACVPPADVSALLQAAFVKSGLDPKLSACVADAVSGQVSVSQLAELGGSTTVPPEIQALLDQAALGCGAVGD